MLYQSNTSNTSTTESYFVDHKHCVTCTRLQTNTLVLLNQNHTLHTCARTKTFSIRFPLSTWIIYTWTHRTQTYGNQRPNSLDHIFSGSGGPTSPPLFAATSQRWSFSWSWNYIIDNSCIHSHYQHGTVTHSGTNFPQGNLASQLRVSIGVSKQTTLHKLGRTSAYNTKKHQSVITTASLTSCDTWATNNRLYPTSTLGTQTKKKRNKSREPIRVINTKLTASWIKPHYVNCPMRKTQQQDNKVADD